MTLREVRKLGVAHYIRERNGRIPYNWIEAGDICRAYGCNRRELDRIIDELKASGAIKFKIFQGIIIVELAEENEKAPQEGRPAALCEKDGSKSACENPA